jgi:hypothetical protein
MLSLYRCGSAAIALLLVLTASLPAQERRPVVALTGGLGNVLGGLGAGVEYYLAGSRVSAAVGLGYWPEESLCDRGTLSGAAAVRGFVGGRHRGFLEVSYSLLQTSCTLFGDDFNRHYGPGLSLGYRYTGSDGFTFTAGAGVGDVPDDFGTEVIVLLGLGYTWQR